MLPSHGAENVTKPFKYLNLQQSKRPEQQYSFYSCHSLQIRLHFDDLRIVPVTKAATVIQHSWQAAGQTSKAMSCAFYQLRILLHASALCYIPIAYVVIHVIPYCAKYTLIMYYDTAGDFQMASLDFVHNKHQHAALECSVDHYTSQLQACN